jgi:hypothetical protein
VTPNFTDRDTSTVSDTHSHTFSGTTNSAGSGQPVENRPLFYKLAFITKL